MEKTDQAKEPIRIAHWTVDVASNRIHGEMGEVQLEPRLMKLLELFIERAGEVLSKETIITHVWDDQIVTNETVSVAIYELRKALGDNARQPIFIKTIRKTGFQWLVPRENPISESIQEGREEVAPAEVAEPAAGDGATPKSPNHEDLVERSLWRRPAIYIAAVVVAVLGLSLMGWLSDLLDKAPPKDSCVAVLPFAYMSEEKEQSYFAAGITEALITDLARATRLRVLPRRSVLPYASSTESNREIGAALGADLLVEGAVQVQNEQVVVTMQMIDPETDRYLWTRSYRKPVHDFFRIQKEASLDLIRYFAEGESAGSLPTGEPDIPADMYHAYLKGRYFLNKGTWQDAEKAVPYFNLVLKKTPGFAPAHAALATCYTLYGHRFEHLNDEEVLALAGEHIEAGLALDQGVAELHLAKAVRAFRDEWHWHEAEESFKTALAQYATDPRAHRWYALFLAASGRSGEALDQIRDAAYLDPLSLEIQYTLGKVLYLSGREEEARAQIERVLELEPGHAEAQRTLFLMRTKTSDQAFFESFRAWQVTLKDQPAVYAAFATIPHPNYLDPYKRPRLLRRQGWREHLSPVTLAAINLAGGWDERALVWLTRAQRQRDPELVWVGTDPIFQRLHEDQRFKNIVERITSG